MSASNAPGGTATGLRDAVLQVVAAKASAKIDDWTRRLDEVVASAGATERAGLEAVEASLEGKNPYLAAVRGAWLGAGWKLRVAAVLSFVLLLVLAPVPMLLLLLALLVAGLVAGIRAIAR